MARKQLYSRNVSVCLCDIIIYIISFRDHVILFHFVIYVFNQTNAMKKNSRNIHNIINA